MFPTYHANLYKELFIGATDIKTKKNIFEGLLNQISDIRGTNLTEEVSNTVGRTMNQKGNIRHAIR
jgi:hypothetical protein